LAVRGLGHSFEQAEAVLRVRDGLAGREALLGPGRAHTQVSCRPQVVAASLEMRGEVGGDLRQAFAVCRFERLPDRLMQPLAPSVVNLLVDHLMMQRMGEGVELRRAAVRHAAADVQEQM
jgi:hypothetical protein